MPLARLRWIILALLSLSTVINYIDRQALSVMLPTLRKQLHLTGSDYGTITTLFLIAYTIAQFFSGVLVDKIGTRKGFVISISIWSSAALAHACATGAATMALFRFLLGVGEAGNWPIGGKAVAQWFPPQRRAFAMGIFDGGSALGAIVAPPLIAVLAIHFSWRAAFVVTGLLGFAWLIAWLWIYDIPSQHKWLSAEDRAKAIEETAATSQNKNNSFSGALASIIGMRQLWGLMATRTAATPVWWFYVLWLPDYLSKCRGFSLADIGMFAWMPFLTVDFGKMLGGALSDNLLKKGWSIAASRKSVMVIGAVFMSAGVMVYGAHTSSAAVAWVCAATFGFGIWSANILALHADIFSSDKMGSALGMTGMGASLGGALTTYLIGKVVDSGGYQPVFFVAGVASFVACLALFFWIGHIDRQNAEPCP